MGSGEEVAQEPGRPENDPQAQHEEPLPEAEQASTQSKKEERPRKKSQQLVEDPDHVSDSDDDEEEEQHCGSRFALRKENKLRTFWESLILVLVAYTGTIFIYRLCFIGFRVYPPDFEPDEEKDDSGWTGFDTFVTVAFWFDLFSGFFLTFSKENGDEVDDLRRALPPSGALPLESRWVLGSHPAERRGPEGGQLRRPRRLRARARASRAARA